MASGSCSATVASIGDMAMPPEAKPGMILEMNSGILERIPGILERISGMILGILGILGISGLNFLIQSGTGILGSSGLNFLIQSGTGILGVLGALMDGHLNFETKLAPLESSE